jgi:hypothetical protein
LELLGDGHAEDLRRIRNALVKHSKLPGHVVAGFGKIVTNRLLDFGRHPPLCQQSYAKDDNQNSPTVFH